MPEILETLKRWKKLFKLWKLKIRLKVFGEEEKRIAEKFNILRTENAV